MLGKKNQAYVEKPSVLLIGSSCSRVLLNVLFPSSVTRTCPMEVSSFLQKRKFCLSFSRHDILMFFFFFSITEKSKRQITNSKKKKKKEQCNSETGGRGEKGMKKWTFFPDFVLYISMIALYKVFDLYFAIDLVHKIKR